MWLGNLTTEISGAWGEKRKIAEIKITSSEFDASGPVREMGNRKKDACIVRWACIFTLQTWVHSVNRIRQVNCTQQAVKAGNRIHVESQFTPQLGSGGASLWKQGSELQSAFFFPLSLSLFFSPVIQHSGFASVRPSRQHYEAVSQSPDACKEVSHIRGCVPHTANSLRKICMGTVLWHGLLSFPC